WCMARTAMRHFTETELRMSLSRRACPKSAGLGAGGWAATAHNDFAAAEAPAALSPAKRTKDLTIKEVRVTPIALPDPPLLAASGCHGPYFLRTIMEIVTTD